MAEPADGRLRGLLVDFGGVLTSNVFASFEAFCRAEGLMEHTVRDRFMKDPMARELLFDLELGRLDEREFERRFAAVLEVERSEGLIDRLFAEMRPDEAMVGAVRAARAGGVRTGLISNSWGAGTNYDRERFAELFDGVVISSDEGLRKPDPAIYEMGARRIGLPAAQCVFVDDLPGNLKPARGLGMTTLHHTDTRETIERLEELFGMRLRGDAEQGA